MRRMVRDAPPIEREAAIPRILEKFGRLNDQQQGQILLVAQALEEGDYATARKYRDMALEDAGKPVTQI